MRARFYGAVLAAILTAGTPVAGAQETPTEPTPSALEDDSRITDMMIPLQLDHFPKRPKPLLELGSPFLGTGKINRGFRIPGGAAWTPSLIVFGNFRSGASFTDDGTTRTMQWANRLDLFTNLYLTSTERVVFGLRPLDESVDGARLFSGYTRLSPDPLGHSGTTDHVNLDWNTVSHLFFEGDLGELFPGIDRRDSKGLDIGFSVGRQPLNFQEGLLINDSIDAVGLTQNNFKPGGTINMRMTALVGWNGINRHTPSTDLLLRNAEAESSQLYGLFTEFDTRGTTVDIDAAYVRSNDFRDRNGVTMPAGDGIYAGVSLAGRPGSGRFNVTVRAVVSAPVGGTVEGPQTLALGDPAAKGSLMLGEFSWTPHGNDNYFYVNAFLGIDKYRAAALDPSVPGPLARAGILFAGPGLGSAPGGLAPTSDDSYGATLGHQLFFGHTRQQIVLEAATRLARLSCASATATCDPHAVAAGARYQAAVGRRGVLVVDGFAARDSLRGKAAVDFGDDHRTRLSGRVELLVKF